MESTQNSNGINRAAELAAIQAARQASQTALEQEVAKLRAENEALKAAKTSNKLGLKVSVKGALSVCGLQRFPVTLYKEQWLRLLEVSEDIKGFIQDHDSQLKAK